MRVNTWIHTLVRFFLMESSLALKRHIMDFLMFQYDLMVLMVPASSAQSVECHGRDRRRRRLNRVLDLTRRRVDGIASHQVAPQAVEDFVTLERLGDLPGCIQ